MLILVGSRCRLPRGCDRAAIKRGALLTALTLTALLVMSAPSSAAKVSWIEADFVSTPEENFTELTVTASPGERNTVTITAGFRGELTVVDDGPELTLAEYARGCRRPSAHVVACPAANRVRVILGDGDDSAVVNGSHFDLVDGGPGNDTLTGGPDKDTFSGGPGADTLNGLAGDDTFLEGPGETGGAATTGSDVINGGLGRDAVDYDGVAKPLTASLRTGRAETAGELDQLIAAEMLVGGAADDTLTGSSADDVLVGGTGSDLLTGGDGDDVLVGYAYSGSRGTGTEFATGGPDRLIAGAGNDIVEGSTPGDTQVSCGAGLDTQLVQRGAQVAADCERVWRPRDASWSEQYAGYGVPIQMSVRPVSRLRRWATFEVSCPKEESGEDRDHCTAAIALRTAGSPAVLLGSSGRVRFAAGPRRRVKVRLVHAVDLGTAILVQAKVRQGGEGEYENSSYMTRY